MWVVLHPFVHIWIKWKRRHVFASVWHKFEQQSFKEVAILYFLKMKTIFMVFMKNSNQDVNLKTNSDCNFEFKKVAVCCHKFVFYNLNFFVFIPEFLPHYVFLFFIFHQQNFRYRKNQDANKNLRLMCICVVSWPY